MNVRDVYLRIEEIVGYSPVEPSSHSGTYRRDCMRNTGHEDATIPLSEVNARSLTALVYREYLDPDYLIPKPDKLVQADVNEPIYTHRVPGTVVYARPGDRLHIHVFNADGMPHSFHVHGLEYGIDSDGSWPLGVQAVDGRRSDEICPGQSWTYRFDVREEMVGAWPFHDHSRHIGESVNRGLFGGIVVLPTDCHEPHGIELPPLVERLRRDDAAASIPDDDRKPPHHEHGPRARRTSRRARRGRRTTRRRTSTEAGTSIPEAGTGIPAAGTGMDAGSARTSETSSIEPSSTSSRSGRNSTTRIRTRTPTRLCTCRCSSTS